VKREPLDYIWWLVSRASGTVALLLVTLSVLMGLLMASGLLKRPGLKRSLVAVHEHVALVALVSIAVHGIALLGDRSINPGPLGVLLPFNMAYRPVYTGLGIISGYLIAALALSFYARKRIGGGRWRRMHRWTVLAYVLGVAHSIGAGSDASLQAVRLAVVASALPAAGLFLARNRPRESATAARRAALSPAKLKAVPEPAAPSEPVEPVALVATAAGG
jgi:methionine sulfoxide reductase heme-binding subunit